MKVLASAYPSNFEDPGGLAGLKAHLVKFALVECQATKTFSSVTHKNIAFSNFFPGSCQSKILED